jgi:hypothetical protein
MARGKTWKVNLYAGPGVEVSSHEVETAEEVLQIVRNAMEEMVNDPGSSINITWDEDGEHAGEA